VLGRLGKQTDTELAAEIGCARQVVQRIRQRLRIPAYHPLNGFEHLLGKLPDQAVARIAGCGANTVGVRRRSLNIAPVRQSQARAGRLLLAHMAELGRTREEAKGAFD